MHFKREIFLIFSLAHLSIISFSCSCMVHMYMRSTVTTRIPIQCEISKYAEECNFKNGTIWSGPVRPMLFFLLKIRTIICFGEQLSDISLSVERRKTFSNLNRHLLENVSPLHGGFHFWQSINKIRFYFSKK